MASPTLDWWSWLRRLPARGPYLELIARSTGIKDPSERRVVEAYWVGIPLLETISATQIGDSMEDRFRCRSGHQFLHLAEGVWLAA